MSKLNLYFLRHGQTQFNVLLRLQGWSNSQLTESGINDATKAGEVFSKIEFDAAYSSDLTRALETGRLFLKAANQSIPITESKGLREIGFGYYEGLDGRSVWNIAELKAKEIYNLPKDAVIDEAMKLDMLYRLDPLGLAENYEQFITRLRNGIEEVVAQHTEGNLLIVSHSSAIKALFNTLDENYKTQVDPGNGSMSMMTYEDGVFTVGAYNAYTVEELTGGSV